MFESLLVVGIVVVAIALAGQSFRKTLKGENGGCGCVGCPRFGCVDGKKHFSYPSTGNDDRCGHPDPEAFDKSKYRRIKKK